jgi:hypothetical protein
MSDDAVLASMIMSRCIIQRLHSAQRDERESFQAMASAAAERAEAYNLRRSAGAPF